MTDMELAEFRHEVCASVLEAIEEMGIPAFRETSFFGSNEVTEEAVAA